MLDIAAGGVYEDGHDIRMQLSLQIFLQEWRSTPLGNTGRAVVTATKSKTEKAESRNRCWERHDGVNRLNEANRYTRIRTEPERWLLIDLNAGHTTSAERVFFSSENTPTV